MRPGCGWRAVGGGVGGRGCMLPHLGSCAACRKRLVSPCNCSNYCSNCQKVTSWRRYTTDPAMRQGQKATSWGLQGQFQLLALLWRWPSQAGRNSCHTQASCAWGCSSAHTPKLRFAALGCGTSYRLLTASARRGWPGRLSIWEDRARRIAVLDAFRAAER